jgi:ABC-type antimicrobial peptide transport system permease subunit
MFRFQLLFILRNFKKHRSSFAINLIGLSSGLVCVLMIYLWAQDELKMDKFHEKDPLLYQVMENSKDGGGINTSENTPGPLAEALAKEMPEVEYAVNVPEDMDDNVILSVGDKNIKANGDYASKDFFKVFSFPLLEGDQNKILRDKNSIAISESLAKKIFNTTQNLIGKTIEFQHEKEFMISGVFKDVPFHSTFRFDYLLPYESFVEKNQWALKWGSHNPNTFLLLKEGTDVANFNKKIEDFLRKKDQYSDVSLFVRPYSDGYLYGKYENGVQAGGRIEYVELFSLIAVFILLIACINFMNLSTAKASRRLKEVGIKKAVGAGRDSLIIQYMGESLLLTFLSLFVAVVLVFFLLPYFNEITGKSLTLQIEPYFIITLLLIALITGIISGSYPALYLSGFNPIAVLKGKLETSVGELLVRKGLVVFQFTLSVIFIFAVVVVYKQIEFIQNKNLGYSKDNVIYFKNEGKIAEKPETL